MLTGIPVLFKYLIKNKPDIVFTAIGHLNVAAGFLSLFFPNTKFVGREVNVTSVQKKYKDQPSVLVRITTKFGYRFLDRIICQSKDMLKDFKSQYKVDPNKLVLINNPITDGFEDVILSKRKVEFEEEPIKLITVASLKKQKGHERILKALSKLKIDFQYTIVGDGGERENINSLILNLGLENKIIYISQTKKVAEILSKQDLFLQGAYVEGFPNCLLESCAVGLPVIAFKAPGGLDELIVEGTNGFIAKNETEYINLIMKSYNGYSWDIDKIRDSVFSKFSKKIIMEQYENLLLETVKNK